MRFVILLDTLIDKNEALKVLEDYAGFIKKHTKLECEFWIERRDFSVVPTEPDGDGDLKPTYQYRQALCSDVHKRYGDYGTDYVVMWVHDDNFLFKGVWGTAWAYTHYKYNFLLARWDKKNKVNTWNTFFHEGEHPHDTTIKKELGVSIEPLCAKEFGIENFDFDRDYVHGQSDKFNYIGRRGYRRDGKMLKFISPWLQQAFHSRKVKHEHRLGLMKNIIRLLERLVEILTIKNKKPE